MTEVDADVRLLDRLTDWRQRLADDVRRGLAGRPPSIPSRWLYDELGSRLFDEITMLPEYYPTRRETEILTARCGDIAGLTGATTLIELGSGTSTKTRVLLDEFGRRSASLRFVPVDVSVEVLQEASATLSRAYPAVSVQPVAADFLDQQLILPGERGRRLVAFLGSTIGNLDDAARSAFLRRLHLALAPGDHLLVGADLVKAVPRLVAAYDDSAGVTAEFNRNVITVIARELGAYGLQAADFQHVARWNGRHSRMEMWLRATRDVHATFPGLGLTWRLRAGDEVRTEISVKFELRRWRRELRTHGFPVRRSWTDRSGDFSLSLAARR